MRKYRISVKYRSPRADLADYVGLSSITHYKNQDRNQNQNLNKVYIRNFHEFQHRKRPGEGKTAKQEYDKELKEESKKQRLKEIESQVSFDGKSGSSFDSNEDDEQIDEQTNDQVNGLTNGHMNGHINGYTESKTNKYVPNGNLKEQNDQTSNALKLRSIKSLQNKTTRTRTSGDFFDALLSNKKLNLEISEYKKCVKICKELSLAKQIQAYQLETLTDNFDTLEDTFNELYQKFKFINRECKLIEKDIERMKTEYCRLLKNDLIKKNNFIKENDYIPIYDEIPSIDLEIFGDLKNYERAYDKYNCYVNYDEYKRLNKLNHNPFLNNNSESCESLTLKLKEDDLVDENNNKIRIELNGECETNEKSKNFIKQDKNPNDKSDDKNRNDDKRKIKQQIEDVLYLMINRPDTSLFCNKINQLVQDNHRLKVNIKRLKYDISNEKRKNAIRKNGGKTNEMVQFEFSDNLDKQKPISRNNRHTINVVNSKVSNGFSSSISSSKLLNSSTRNLSTNKSINKFGSRISSLNVFEIPTQKVEIFQMKLKMQNKDLELQVSRLRKMNELIENQLEERKKSLEVIQRNERIYLNEEQKQLTDKVEQLKIREKQLLKENENLIKKLHQLTDKS